MENTALLVVVHGHAYLGSRSLGAKWPQVMALVREGLRAAGGEEAGSGEGHWVTRFHVLTEAFAALEGALRAAKKDSQWAVGQGPLPLQIVLHPQNRDEPPPEWADPSAPVWRLLAFESLHATEALRRAWGRQAAGTGLSEAVFLPATPGFHRVRRPGEAAWPELFPNRALPYLWGGEECFYCGLTNHAPRACPSRQLTIDVHGFSEVGHLRPAELADAYRRALGDPEELARRLGAGIHQAQLRKDPLLTASVAFFDVLRIYQLRFLIHLAFHAGSRWPGIRNPGRARASVGSNLYLGLDCLRVGKWSDAEAILSDRRRVGKADRFYAEVGLAFLSLEQGRPRDMVGILERVAVLASNAEERLYLQLLFSRCFELMGDLDRAQAAAEKVLAIRAECAEGHYRRAQLLVRGGTPDRALLRIRSLAQGDPDYFALTLMDPQLYPIAGAVDEMLAETLDSAAASAAKSLDRARAECGQLSAWLEPEDPELEANAAMLGRLEELAARQGYADLLEAADRAEGLVVSCSHLRKRRLKALRAALEGQQQRWAWLGQSWKGYPYKALFRVFGTLLADSGRDLQEAFPLAHSEDLASYRAARDLLERVRKAIDEMESMVSEMASTQRVVAFFRRFTVRLALYEVAVIPLTLFGLPLAAGLLGGDAGPLRALGDPLVRHRTVAVLGCLLVPALALARSLRPARPPSPRATEN